MNRSAGRAGQPRACTNSSKARCRSAWSGSSVSRNACHSLSGPRSADPEKTGGRSASGSSSGLQETMRTQGTPAASTAGKATTLSWTMTSGWTSVKISPSRSSTYIAPGDELLPDGQDQRFQLLAGRLAEMRRRIADEVLPELPRLLRHLRRRLQPHQPLLEPFGFQRSGERLLDHEDDPMAALLQDIRDADAVVRRAEGALREEDHRPGGVVAVHRPRRSAGRQPVSAVCPYLCLGWR